LVDLSSIEVSVYTRRKLLFHGTKLQMVLGMPSTDASFFSGFSGKTIAAASAVSANVALTAGVGKI
jgi:hypothetical protein